MPTVEKISETKNGDILIQTQSTDSAALLKDKLNGKFDCNDISLRTGMKHILHVKNIDAITSKEEIEEAINAATLDLQGPKEVTNLRPSWGHCQIATIRTDAKIANRLLHEGFITVGYTRCRVYERIEVKRCSRCWGFNHSIKECNGPNRSDLCARCSQPGHKAVDCKSAASCPLCNTPGHTANSLKCPIFYKAYKAIRQSKRNNVQ